MKKFIFNRYGAFVISILLCVTKLSALEADIHTNVFYLDKQAYVEINYVINSRSKLQQGVKLDHLNFTAILSSNQNIIKAEKLILNQAPNANTSIMLHVFRWTLPTGKYQLNSTFVNPNDSTEELSLINEIHVPAYKENVFISDIQLFSLLNASQDIKNPFYKNGYYYEPLPFHQLLKTDYYLMAYAELYNTSDQKINDYILHFSITRKDSIKDLSMEWYKRRKGSTIEPVFVKQDISSLASGEYVFSIEIKDLKNNVLGINSVNFTRINPFWDKIIYYQKLQNAEKDYFVSLNADTVDMVLKSLSPVISTEYKDLIQFMHKSGKQEERKLLNYQYWKELRPENPIQVYKAYLADLAEINNRFFCGMGQGYETDRGIIQIKYGKPNEIITEEHDNGAFPYEIWKYNKIESTKQVNVKFLFYDPGLTGSAYELLHSTARGEKINKQWEIELYKNVKGQTKGKTGPDATQIEDNFLRRARTYFEE